MKLTEFYKLYPDCINWATATLVSKMAERKISFLINDISDNTIKYSLNDLKYPELGGHSWIDMRESLKLYMS